jgi:hypothetical protein
MVPRLSLVSTQGPNGPSFFGAIRAGFRRMGAPSHHHLSSLTASSTMAHTKQTARKSTGGNSSPPRQLASLPRPGRGWHEDWRDNDVECDNEDNDNEDGDATARVWGRGWHEDRRDNDVECDNEDNERRDRECNTSGSRSMTLLGEVTHDNQPSV